MRHNIAFLFFHEQQMQARFIRRAFFRSNMHNVTLTTRRSSSMRRPSPSMGGCGETVLEVRLSALS